MIATIKIQPQMNCEYICHRIQEAILKYQKDNPDLTDSILIIDIQKPNDSEPLIPRLEYDTNLT